jgi:hypothetical protein
VYSYLISSMLWILQTSNFARREYEERLVHLDVLMREKNLPIGLRENIRDYFYMKNPNHVFCDEADMMRDMPMCYVRKIRAHDACKVLEGVAILKEHHEFAAGLAPFMVRSFVGCSEIIFDEGFPANSIFFVESGSVSLSSRAGETGNPYDVIIGKNCVSSNALSDTQCPSRFLILLLFVKVFW